MRQCTWAIRRYLHRLRVIIYWCYTSGDEASLSNLVEITRIWTRNGLKHAKAWTYSAEATRIYCHAAPKTLHQYEHQDWTIKLAWIDLGFMVSGVWGHIRGRPRTCSELRICDIYFILSKRDDKDWMNCVSRILNLFLTTASNAFCLFEVTDNPVTLTFRLE